MGLPTAPAAQKYCVAETGCRTHASAAEIVALCYRQSRHSKRVSMTPADLRAWRAAMFLTQQQAAEALGVSPAHGQVVGGGLCRAAGIPGAGLRGAGRWAGAVGGSMVILLRPRLALVPALAGSAARLRLPGPPIRVDLWRLPPSISPSAPIFMMM